MRFSSNSQPVEELILSPSIVTFFPLAVVYWPRNKGDGNNTWSSEIWIERKKMWHQVAIIFLNISFTKANEVYPLLLLHALETMMIKKKKETVSVASRHSTVLQCSELRRSLRQWSTPHDAGHHTNSWEHWTMMMILKKKKKKKMMMMKGLNIVMSAGATPQCYDMDRPPVWRKEVWADFFQIFFQIFHLSFSLHNRSGIGNQLKK